MEALQPGVRLMLAALFYVAAYGIGLLLFIWAAQRRGLTLEALWPVIGAALIGALVGAELIQQLASGTPGKTLLGGVAGGWLAVVVAKRKLGYHRPLGDLFAFALAGGEAVGRLGCFVYGCCYGKIAHLPWAVWDHGAPRHPTQLYSSLAAMAVLGILVELDRRAHLPDNALFFLQGALMCAMRFVIEIYRDGSTYGGLTVAQYACFGGFGFFAFRLHRLLRRTTVAA
jgi:phosphatidylglycerol:prolipoprotein diacylglycerol transferase